MDVHGHAAVTTTQLPYMAQTTPVYNPFPGGGASTKTYPGGGTAPVCPAQDGMDPTMLAMMMMTMTMGHGRRQLREHDDADGDDGDDDGYGRGKETTSCCDQATPAAATSASNNSSVNNNKQPGADKVWGIPITI